VTNLFQDISEKNREKILKLLEAHTMNFPAYCNVLPLIQGDNIICVIDAGSLKIVRNDYDGKVDIIEELGTNKVFGSLVTLAQNNYYEIITKEPTTLTVIDYDNILNMDNVKYDYYFVFLKNLLRIMNETTHEKNERIEILSKRSIRDKLLEYFRIESKRVGSNVIYLPFSFSELANYLSVDRSAMSRELKYLKEEGFISVSGRKIKLDMYIKP